LADYANIIYSSFVSKPEQAYITSVGDELTRLGTKLQFTEMLERMEQEVSNLLQEDGVKE